MISPFKKIKHFFNSKKAVNIATLDEFQEVLYESDMGVQTIEKIMSPLKKKVFEHKQLTVQSIEQAFSEIFLPKLSSLEKAFVLKNNPAIIMMVGVNGVGKTTTIAKIARRYQIANKKTLLVAADTFRAAAVEQLRKWGERLNIEVFLKPESSDPSSVIFDAIEYATRNQFDVVLVDTAGRMHTDKPLMEELKKMKRVIQKKVPNGPDEIVAVVDANTGKNALEQCRVYHKALGLTGIILSKFDGTAKGGILLTVADELNIPIAYLGLGEKIDDLKPFKAKHYLEMLFSKK